MTARFNPEGEAFPPEGDAKPEMRKALEDEERFSDEDELWISRWLTEHRGANRGDAMLALRLQRQAESEGGSDTNK